MLFTRNISFRFRFYCRYSSFVSSNSSVKHIFHNKRQIHFYQPINTRLSEMEFISESFDRIIQSNGDSRSYKGLVLTNGLKVLLISDKDTDKSAASLDVNIGSMSDPRQVPGLAHFLEHMLFLGTQKYPEENDYTKYISQNGGCSNAYTSGTNTNYYFDISPPYIAGALDRFAQFFLQPLFTEDATDREINAVNSEYERGLDDDGWRISQLEKTLCDQSHDFSKFGTGNLETLSTTPKLNGIDVREELLKFHKKWYSANIMSLVVLGKESLEELLEIVVPLFSGITNKSVLTPIWESHPITPSYLQKQTWIVPIKDNRSLSIAFPIPDLVPHYKSQPGHYIAHLIGHEGPGSLLSELKSRGLCSFLNGYDRRGAKGFGFFHVSVDLTEEGIERIDEIVKLIFQYINMLKREGPKEWIFEECKNINSIKFHFKDKERPINYVRDLASCLQDIPINDCLTVEYLLEEYDPILISDVLNKLTPENVRVAIVGKKFKGNTDSVEKWYKTEYKHFDIEKPIINLWSDCGFNDRLNLPPKNEFIPNNLDLVKREDVKSSFPEMLRNTEMTRLWFMQDNEYLKPKVYYGFEFTNPLSYVDPFHSNATCLFTRLFRDSLNEYAYNAELAGMFYSLSNSVDGLSLELGGYNDNLQILLSKIINKMVNFKIDPKRFDILKEIYIRGLRNYPTRPMHELLHYYTGLLTTERYWSIDELLETANDMTVENLSQFIPQLLSQFHIEALIHGNVSKSQAIQIVDMVENEFRKHMNTKSLSLSQHFRNREFQFADESSYCFETITNIHQTKAIQLYYQVGVQETTTNTTLELINQLINEPCFHVLRTQEQLGYMTFSALRRANGVQGLRFVIQSDYMPSYLDQRIEAFILWAENYIREMSDEDFNANKNALIANRLEKPKQLIAFSRKLWHEIDSKQYNFNRDQIEVESIKKLTKDDVIAFYKKHLGHDSPIRKKLAVCIINKNASNEIKEITPKEGLHPSPKLKEAQRIVDINQFKNRLGLYPLPEPFIDIYKIEKSKL